MAEREVEVLKMKLRLRPSKKEMPPNTIIIVQGNAVANGFKFAFGAFLFSLLVFFGVVVLLIIFGGTILNWMANGFQL